MRTFIIDDSKTMRNILKNALEQLGNCEIAEAADGQDALNKIDAFNPELILVDWNMPVMDGITFVRNYRAKGKKTPIIMVTTEAEKTRVVDAIKAGVNNYVIKPFTPDQIKKVVTETMAKAGSAAPSA